LIAILICYERIMIINRISTPKSPEALQDRAVEALAKVGHPPNPGESTAWGMSLSTDYAAFVERTSTAPDRWKLLRTARPEALALWYRTSPRPLIPIGRENPVSGQNPPLNASGMTLTVVDASGRLSEFVAIPEPRDDGSPSATPDWKVLFDAAGIDMAAFKPATPQVVPPVFADERVAWDGRLPELPEHTFRVEAAGYKGKPVYFVVSGPWTRYARSTPGAVSLFNVLIANARWAAQVFSLIPDTTAPAQTLAVNEGTNPGGQFFNSGTNTHYYNTGAGGDFTVTSTPTDADSGVTSVAFAAVALTGFTHTTVTDTTSPYNSNTYAWTTGNTTSPGANQTTVTDRNANTVQGLTITRDVTQPTVFSTQSAIKIGIPIKRKQRIAAIAS